MTHGVSQCGETDADVDWVSHQHNAFMSRELQQGGMPAWRVTFDDPAAVVNDTFTGEADALKRSRCVECHGRTSENTCDLLEETTQH